MCFGLRLGSGILGTGIYLHAGVVWMTPLGSYLETKLANVFCRSRRKARYWFGIVVPGDTKCPKGQSLVVFRADSASVPLARA